MRDVGSPFAVPTQTAGDSRSRSGGICADSILLRASRGSGAPLRRAVARFGILGLLIASFLAMTASPASAVDTGHSFSFSFTPTGTSEMGAFSSAIVVDNSSGPSAGDVYVTDTQRHRIQKFDPDGNFILMFGKGVNATTGGDLCTAASGDTCKNGVSSTASGGFANPNRIEVDQSSGAVYVAASSSRVAKYDENGNLVTGWSAGGYVTGETTETGPYSGIYGIAVTSTSEVRIVGFSGGNYILARFNGTTGAFVSQFTVGFYPGESGYAWSPQGFDYFAHNGNIKRMSAADGSNPVWVNKFFTGTLYQYTLTADTSNGFIYSIITNYGNGENNVAEWRVNGSGQPLDAAGSPCTTTLSGTTGGCPPTHEFGQGFGGPGYGDRGAQRGVAVDTSTGRLYTVAQSSAQQSKVNVYVAAPAPIVTTGAPVAKKTVSGNVKPDGAGEVVECYFEYGTTKQYGSKQNCSPAAPFATDQAVTADLPLTGETLYHYRLVAKNAAGATNFGSNETILPHNVDGLETLAAENVTRTAAKMNASFKGNGENTNYYFEWGPTTAYGTTSAVPPGPSAGSPTYPPATALSYDATGLLPETEYHYRVVGENSLGQTLGNDRTFKTLPAVQSLTTKPADPVGRKFATLHASFLGDGDNTTYTFEWGKTSSYGNSTPVGDAGSPSGLANVSAALTGLELETTYHYRIVATNSLGTTKGSDQSFTTLPAVGGLTTKPATDISHESITLHGEYLGNGENTHYYFEYGLTTAYGQISPEEPGTDAGSPTGSTPISTVITDYEAYSTYHFRVVATNAEGKTVGQDMTFVTDPAPLPEITGTAASGVSNTRAMFEAEIDPNRWATVYLFQYGPTAAYGEETEVSQPIGSDDVVHPVSEEVQGLAPGTAYHFRAVAINFTGTQYGPDQVLTTADRPRVELPSASALGETTAHLGGQVNPNSAPTTVHFEYGPSGSYGQSTPAVGIGSGAANQAVGTAVAGLAAGTTYHFRIVASNAYGTAVGPDQTFATLAARTPPIVEPPPKRKRCKKGFKKRKGKCVKKRKHRKQRKRNQHRNSTRRDG